MIRRIQDGDFFTIPDDSVDSIATSPISRKRSVPSCATETPIYATWILQTHNL